MKKSAVVVVATMALATVASAHDAVQVAGASSSVRKIPAKIPTGDYVILGWNDLGMHCMGPDFSALCLLPPYNNVWAQVIHRAPFPNLVTSGIEIDYRFPDNTDSAGKVNFWNYAQALFGLPNPLPANIGLTGNGLTGQNPFDGAKGAYEVTGIPITPFDDAAPTTLQPYQLAELTLKLAGGGAQLDQTVIVAPVSTEMHCDQCHHEDNMTVWDVILTKHDEEEDTNLMGSKPVLCGSCHADAALGTPGQAGLPSLSYAIHNKHADEEGPDMDCYLCHPGTQTQCLRDVMFSAGLRCVDCHGNTKQVADSQKANPPRRPWLDEPRCEMCHPDHPEEAGKLYRNSKGHGGLYCSACHNSPHAILPTIQERDMRQAVRVQDRADYIKNCQVCHTQVPSWPGPHGVIPSQQIRNHLLKRALIAPSNLPGADVNTDTLINAADLKRQSDRGL